MNAITMLSSYPRFQGRVRNMASGWYVYRDRKREGPFTVQQLKEEARSGRLKPLDQVWSEETPGWIPAGDAEGIFAEPPPPPPPPEGLAVRSEALHSKRSTGRPSVGGFLLMLVIGIIPVVNVITLTIWSFGSRVNDDRRNLARALLIWLLLIAIACVTVYMFWYFGSI